MTADDARRVPLCERAREEPHEDQHDERHEELAVMTLLPRAAAAGPSARRAV